MMKMLRAALALIVLASPVYAQGVAQLGSGEIWGNASGVRAPAGPTTSSAWFNRWCSGTSGSVPTATGANTWGCTGSTGTGNVVKATSPTITTPVISGGTVDNAIIGGSTPAAGTFTALTATQQVVQSGRVTSTISGNQNDWTPSGTGTYSQSSAVFVDGGTADRTITGLTGGAAGRQVRLVNTGTNDIILTRESSSSTAANRFFMIDNYIVYPNTETTLSYDGTLSRWRLGPVIQRIKMTESKVFYVATTGSDTANSCISAASPCLTLNRAWGIIKDWYDLNGFQAIISVADGTYTAGLTATGPLVGNTITTGVQVIGNTTTPANVLIIPTSGYAIYVSEGARVYLRGVELSAQNSNSDLVYSGAWSRFSYDTIIFGWNIGGYDIQAGANSEVSILGGYRISKPIFTKTCTLTPASATVACADTSGLVVGLGITTAAGTDFTPTAYITAIDPNVSVTVNSSAYVLGTGSKSVIFATGGLAHLQTDPNAYLYSSTSIGDGGNNQLVVDTTAYAFYSNAFIFGDDSRQYIPRLAFLTRLENVSTTATFTSASTTIVLPSTAGISPGWLVVHPNITWGTTVSSITNGTDLVISALPTGSATAGAIAFGTLATINAVPFAMYNNRGLLDSRMTGTASDITTLPGWRLTFNASFVKGSNVITVSAGDAAAIAAYFNRFSGFRGLALQNSFLPDGTVIPDVNSISGSKITISQAATSGSGGVVSVKAGGFLWEDGQLAKLRGPPVISGNYLPSGLVMGGRLIGADFNSTADQAITIHSPTTNYKVLQIVFSNASTSLTTAAGGVYTEAAKGGVALLAAGSVYTTLTGAAVNAAGSQFTPGLTATTLMLDKTTIYLSLTTAQGAAATADVHVYIQPLYP